MKKINMISKNFSHDFSSTVNKKPKYFEWDYFKRNSDFSFYCDSDIMKGIEDINDGKTKFLWTLESPFFNGNVFEIIINNLDDVLRTYELIFTYNIDLLKLSDKFKWVPAMGSWIKEPQITKKTKLLSMITSSKTHTPQQVFRKNFAEENKYKLDLYGRGFREISEKEEGLVDYMFSVCIENANKETYFTEKILDCFCTGTIPIYSGTKKICEHFDCEGVIFLDDFSIEKITEELYISKTESIRNNFEIAQQFLIPEDYIYKNYLLNYF